MLTAKAASTDKINSLEVGLDDFIPKPFKISELRSRISNLLIQRENLKKRFQKQVFLKPEKITINTKDEEFMDRATEIVEENISNASFSVEEFQREMGLSRMQLHRKFKALTGKSSGEFIRYIRMNSAAELLVQNTATVAEIAYEVGFSDPSYFTKCFKNEFGVSPTEYAINPSKSKPFNI